MTGVLAWQWANENVEASLQTGEQLSAESTLVLAGPSRLSMISDDGSGEFLGSSNSLIGMGTLQNFSLTQNRPQQKIFEIGSKRSYFIPQRQFSQFTASKIMFGGPSLLRLMYALAPDRLVAALGTPLNIDPDSNGNGVAQLPEYNALFQEGELRNLPGYGGTNNEDNRDFWNNLTSEIFGIPFGMALIFKTAQDKPYGATYLEDCVIESYQFGLDANNVVIAESVSGQFDRATPIQLATQASLTI